MTARILVALTLSLAAASAFAAPAPAASSTDAAASSTASQKSRCMRHKEIGSNRTKKVCMSAERWNSLSPAERDAAIRSDKEQVL